MGISVDITGWPKLTDAEVAKQYGVSVKRQKAIKKIVQEVTRQLDSENTRKATASKNSAPRRKAA